METIICLDLGTAHTGIAISYEGILAQPLTTIFESKRDKLLGKLLPIIAKNHPEKIVIGTPNHGPLVKEVMDFKLQLEKIFSGEIILFPEDLSSRSAKSLLKDTGKTLARRKKAEHQTAAAIILEDYLDSSPD
jgi:putative transcription antitermination factor YqgF